MKQKNQFTATIGKLALSVLLMGFLSTANAQEGSKQATIPDPANDPVYKTAEQMPQFPGGETAMRKFLSDNLVYPADAKKAGIEGVTYIGFEVSREGRIENAKILKGFNADCDGYALRAIQGMPNWEPGMQNGKAVRVQYSMPIRFSLDGTKK